ncbi:hypothetical protein QLQ12_00485 [Actinoplanes sp. NEAU-A12]|uniref:Uncharacterized protein n=1 Tax=Actinoplanes sandaracinus TaxID=3045177 RepID=A0ABT6WBH2_9ACTN|nr:hypothetical protein [Actinoplanes sandaracinus]MDI6097084.1 hypothetical protein [Actinoplanes sandaracinus]
MSGNGPSAHRAAGSAQRNRLIAVGAGLLLALILLFSLLALCTNRGGDDTPTAGPASSVQVSTGAVSPGVSGPGGTSPRGVEPGTTTSGDAGAGPSGGGSATVAPPGAGAPATTEPTGDAEATADPERSPTPSGGVDTGGGSLVPGRRLALLVTGVFLLLAAAAAGAYALRRPLHHR